MTIAADLFDTASVASNPGGRSTRGPSRLACIGECERRYVLRFHHGYQTKEDPTYRRTGTLIHLHMAFHFGAMMQPQPAWLVHRDAYFAQAALGYPEEARAAEAAFTAFKANEIGMGWEPIAVEREFAAPLGALDASVPPALAAEVVTARADLVVKINGVLWVVDWKTQQPRGTHFPPMQEDGEWAIHWQSLVLLHLVRHELGPVQGMIIGRIARKPPYAFDTQVLSTPARPYTDTPRVLTELVRRERELQQRVASGGKAFPSFWQCYGRFGACDYLRVCRAQSTEAALKVLASDFDKEGA